MSPLEIIELLGNIPAGVKIRDIKDIHNNVIFNKVLMAYIFSLLGIVDFPRDLPKFVLHNEIQQNFANLSLLEMKTAFVAAATGKLGDFDIKLYGSPFNFAFFSMVVNKYIEVRNQQIRTQPQTKNLLEVPKSDIERAKSDKEKIEIRNEAIRKSFNQYAKDKTVKDFNNLIFQDFYNASLITYSESEKQAALKQAEKIIKDEKASTFHNTGSLSVGFILRNWKSEKPADEIVIEAKKILLKQFYERIISEKKTIDDYIRLLK